jgi:hypothetical protein
MIAKVRRRDTSWSMFMVTAYMGSAGVPGKPRKARIIRGFSN